MEFVLCESECHTDGWGPSVTLPSHCTVPFAIFNKMDRLGKPADFMTTHDYRRDRYNQYGTATKAFSYQVQDDESSFSVVDTKPKVKSTFAIQRIGGFRGRGRGRGRARGRGGVWLAQRSGLPPVDTSFNRGQQPQRKKNRFRWESRRRWNSRDWDNEEKPKLPSIAVDGSWPEVKILPLSTLESESLSFLAGKTTTGGGSYGRERGSSDEEATAAVALAKDQALDTLTEAGTICAYNQTYDRISTRSTVPIKLSAAEPLASSAAHDPIMERLHEQKAANVYATDTVLSMLMAASRSVDSWDILVRKSGDEIWLDMRPDSNLLVQTVHETSTATMPTDEDDINHRTQLSREATMLNAQFRRQVLRGSKMDERLSFEENSPFEQSNLGYRYRRFTLSPTLRVLARCTVHAYSHKRNTGEKILLHVRMFNEFENKVADNSDNDWRLMLDSQRGFIVATQFISNACSASRWISEALLSGIDEMRVGFLSRQSVADPSKHIVLGVQRFKPREFATQASVKQEQLWGSLKAAIDAINTLDDGHFVMLRDPNEPVIRFYSVPESDFYALLG